MFIARERECLFQKCVVFTFTLEKFACPDLVNLGIHVGN